MTDDDSMLRALEQLWERVDPAPADLAERVLFALSLETLDAELLSMSTPDLAAARAAGDEESARTVTFGSENLTVMVTLSGSDAAGHRIDGWIVPSLPLRVDLRTAHDVLTTTAETTGRFAFPVVPGGLVQLVLHLDADSLPPLPRRVVTPAFTL